MNPLMMATVLGRNKSLKKVTSHTHVAKKTCGICFELKTDYEIFSIRSTILKRRKCKHFFCVDCICKYVEVEINENPLKVMCPSPKCCVKYKPEHFNHILPKKVFNKWEYLISDFSIPSEEKTYCPFENCSVLLGKEDLIEKGVDECSSKCPSCHRRFCTKCKVPWHGGMSCQRFQAIKRNNPNDLDTIFLELAKSEMWQRCPHCSMFVKRVHGCSYIQCRFVMYPISLANP